MERPGLGINDHWQQMKGLMTETAQDICGMTKGPRRHKETRWWNGVAEAVRKKKIKYRKWKKENTKEVRKEYKKNTPLDRMQRGLSRQQRKRNRRNVQMT